MNLEGKEILAVRPNKTVYRDGDRTIKVFTDAQSKVNVFNEALCTARVEESGLDIPKILEVCTIDGHWALALEHAEGTSLQQLMDDHPENLEQYMEQFVELQLTMHSYKAARLPLQKSKFTRKISSLKDTVSATIRYELHVRLDSMPAHKKLCHGDFNPSNVVVRPDGSMTILDWAHATQGNASGDAAITYLQFALKNQKLADLYLNLFCQKSDTAKQYVLKWVPIAAAVQLTKGIEEEKEFLMRWIDVIDFQ